MFLPFTCNLLVVSMHFSFVGNEGLLIELDEIVAMNIFRSFFCCQNIGQKDNIFFHYVFHEDRTGENFTKIKRTMKSQFWLLSFLF